MSAPAAQRRDRDRDGVAVRWLGLLSERNFRLLWIGESTSAVGTNVSRVALPLVALVTLGASAFQVSLLTALTWAPWLVVGLPAGAWVDRLPRRAVMLVCDAVSLVVLLSIPIATWAGALNFAHLVGVALLVGTASVFSQTAHQVYLPGLVHPAQLPEANAKLQGSEAAAQVAGPSIAGALAQALGAVAGLLVDAVSFAVSAMCLLGIRSPERTPAAGPTHADDAGAGLRRQIAGGLHFLAHDPYLRVLTAYGALSNLALTGYQAILVVFLLRDVGVHPAILGVALSGMSVGGLLGAVLAPTLGRRCGTARGMLAANLTAGPFALLIPLATPGPRLMFVVVGGIGVGAAVVAGNVLKGSFRQTYTPRHLLGRVVVGMQFLNYGTIPLGALLGGALSGPLGLRHTIWIMAGVTALAPLLLLLGPLKKHRNFPDRPPTSSFARVIA